MNRIVTSIVSLLIVGASVGALVQWGTKPEAEQKEEPDDARVTVRTKPAHAWSGGFHLSVDGEASSQLVVSVGTEVEGKIAYRSPVARNGNFVREGAILYRVDSTKYDLDVRRLEAQENQARTELASIVVDIENTKALLELAREDHQIKLKQLKRLEELRRRNATDDVTVETAHVEELRARNTKQTLINSERSLLKQKDSKAAALELASAQLSRARVDVDRCTITASVEGRIADDAVEKGDFVKQGQILVRISDSSQMEVKCFLKPEEVAWVWSQKNRTDLEPPPEDDGSVVGEDPIPFPRVPCEVSFEFEGVTTRWAAYIDRLEGTGIDRETRTFPCRILVPEPNSPIPQESKDTADQFEQRKRLPALLSGLYVNVQIKIETPELVQVPLTAIRQGSNVWLMRDGKLEIRNVRVVHVDGDRALVEQAHSGIAPNDRVVVTPLVSVVDGMEVKEDAPEASE